MKILITGATGFLGPYLMQAFSELGEITGVARHAYSEYNCDLTRPGYVSRMMESEKPDIIVHAAAMTNVDECALKPHEAVKANCLATENVAEYAPLDSRLIYISTDMIYSGPGLHRENSKSESPINMYGLTKYMGEFAATKHANHLIVRTNMFGFSKGEKKGLVDFFVQKFKSGTTVQLFNDSYFSPLWTKTLSQYLVHMATNERTGTFNLGSHNGMSKLKFALTLANELGLPTHNAVMTESNSIPDRAPRPLDTRLDVTKVESQFGFTLPTLEMEIKAMCKEYLCVH